MTYPLRRLLLLSTFGFLLAALSAFTVDQALSQYFKLPELERLWLTARSVTNVGLGDPYFITAIGLYIFSKWIRPQYEKLRAWSRDFFFALLVSGLFTHLIKFSVGRQRPHKTPDFDPLVFHPFTPDWDFHSFVSGHSQVMFTVATMLALAFPKGRWFFYLIASVFAFTRVIIHDHFLSDVIGGAVVGVVGSFTAIYWVQLWLRRSSSK